MDSTRMGHRVPNQSGHAVGLLLIGIAALAMAFLGGCGAAEVSRPREVSFAGTSGSAVVEKQGKLSVFFHQGQLLPFLEAADTHRYALVFLPNSQVKPESLRKEGRIVFQEGRYLVRGYVGKTLVISDPIIARLIGNAPVVEVVYFERLD